MATAPRKGKNGGEINLTVGQRRSILKRIQQIEDKSHALHLNLGKIREELKHADFMFWSAGGGGKGRRRRR
jgi:hypothetical protein